jgi:hypothetical protein
LSRLSDDEARSIFINPSKSISSSSARHHGSDERQPAQPDREETAGKAVTFENRRERQEVLDRATKKSFPGFGVEKQMKMQRT